MVKCDLCPRVCALEEGKIGACGARICRNGTVGEVRHGYYSAMHVDPIEKKPLYHFYPGTTAFSLGGFGCNLMCRGCQNYGISRVSACEGDGIEKSAREVVAMAKEARADSVAYTYNEPIVWWETMDEVACAAHESGLKNVMVTAGYVSRAMHDRVFEHMDAVNIDLKGFREAFYREWAQGHLNPVLDTLTYLRDRRDLWTEVTTLIIPGVNDDVDSLCREFEWLYAMFGGEVVLHLSAFFPRYRAMDIESTSEDTLEMARKLAKEAGLRYVYLGNVMSPNDTHCSGCGLKLISRMGYRVEVQNMRGGKCLRCGEVLKGVFR